MIWKSVVSFLFFSVQKSVSSSKVIKGFFLQKGLSQNYVFLNAHSLPLNCKIGKKGEYGFSVFFLFWKNGKFLFPFPESRLSQWLRQGCTIGKARNFETWLREYYLQSKKWLHYHKNVPDVWYFRGEEKKKAEKMLSKMTPVHTTDFWSTRNLFNLRLIRN